MRTIRTFTRFFKHLTPRKKEKSLVHAHGIPVSFLCSFSFFDHALSSEHNKLKNCHKTDKEKKENSRRLQ